MSGNGLKKTASIIAIVIGGFTLLGLIGHTFFVPKSEFETHLVWAASRNAVLEATVKSNTEMIIGIRAVADSINTLNRKVDHLEYVIGRMERSGK